MGKAAFGNFADLTGTGETAAVDVSHLEEIAVGAFGTWAGTIELQVSFDGTNFTGHPTLTAKTAVFSGAVGFRCKQIRFSCSAFTSGTIETAYSGTDEDREG